MKCNEKTKTNVRSKKTMFIVLHEEVGKTLRQSNVIVWHIKWQNFEWFRSFMLFFSQFKQYRYLDHWSSSPISSIIFKYVLTLCHNQKQGWGGATYCTQTSTQCVDGTQLFKFITKYVYICNRSQMKYLNIFKARFRSTSELHSPFHSINLRTAEDPKQKQCFSSNLPGTEHTNFNSQIPYRWSTTQHEFYPG